MVSIENGFEPPGILSDMFETPRARMGCKPPLATLAIHPSRVMIEPRVVTNGRNACVSLILRHQSKQSRRECINSKSDRSHGYGSRCSNQAREEVGHACALSRVGPIQSVLPAPGIQRQPCLCPEQTGSHQSGEWGGGLSESARLLFDAGTRSHPPLHVQ